MQQYFRGRCGLYIDRDYIEYCWVRTDSQAAHYDRSLRSHEFNYQLVWKYHQKLLKLSNRPCWNCFQTNRSVEPHSVGKSIRGKSWALWQVHEVFTNIEEPSDWHKVTWNADLVINTSENMLLKCETLDRRRFIIFCPTETPTVRST